MVEDDHFIAANKGVCNNLDASVYTTSVAGIEASTCGLCLPTDWTASAKPKNNGKRA
jgi:hypothetical protein